jgi:hypothetical protein
MNLTQTIRDGGIRKMSISIAQTLAPAALSVIAPKACVGGLRAPRNLQTQRGSS